MKKQEKRRAAAKNLRAVQTSRHLHVAHRRHTGHVIHKRHTSYPTLAMIVLCVGVFLVSWTRFVVADFPGPIQNDYTVHASVPGPAPTIAATIDSPSSGQKFTSLPVKVRGSCPTNTYITLYRNGAFSGVALCDVTGHYNLLTGLFVGTNKLQARVFSLTDVPGPISDPVTVSYEPSNPPEGSGSSTAAKPAAPIAEPLLFKSDFVFEGHYTGTKTVWQLDVEGGTPPYAVSVDWGDGSRSLVSRPKAGLFTIEHIYRHAGNYKGSYVTNFMASDAAGTQAYLQLLAIVNDPPPAVAGSSQKGTLVSSGQPKTIIKTVYLSHILRYVWPSYAIVVLMLVSFWLGERRELLRLRHRPNRTRHA